MHSGPDTASSDLAVRVRDEWGGVARTRQLRSAGVTASALAAAVDRGCLIQPRRGLYAVSTLDTGVRHALGHRAVLACVSAARYFALWTLDAGVEEPLHVWSDPARHSSREPDCACISHRGMPMSPWTRRDPLSRV